MAQYFGSAVDGTPQGSQPQSTKSPAHARKRSTISTIDQASLTQNDTITLGYFKSSDQLIDIKFFTDGAAGAGTLDIGLSSVEFRDGTATETVVDADLFANGQSVTSAIAYDAAGSVFDESTTLDDVMDRGKPLWQLAALGAASYTSDPGLTFAIVATVNATINATTEMGFEIEYVAGD